MNNLQQALQVGAIFTIMGAFALAEWRMGFLFPAQANREDQRLDVAATLMLPAVSGAVLAVSQALCAWAMPEQRQAWADWSWCCCWPMTSPNTCGTDSATPRCCGLCTGPIIRRPI